MAEPSSDLLSIFLMEAWDGLATLEDGLDRLQASPVTSQGLEPLVVVSHRLKGSAALHGFPELSRVAGAAEQLLEQAPRLPAAEQRGAADFLADLVGLLKKVLDGIGGAGTEDVEEIATFRARHPRLFTPGGPVPWSAARSPAGHGSGELDTEILAYFGPEASEHLETMTRALLALERTGRNEEELGALFRAVHTLKGAAYTVGCTAVGDLSHQIEDLLVAVRDEPAGLTLAVVEAVLAGVDALRALLGLVDAPVDLDATVERVTAELARLAPSAEETSSPAEPVAVPAGVAARPARAPERRVAAAGPSIRVTLERLDALMNLVGELVTARSRLDRRLRDLDRVGELLLFSRTRMAKAVRNFENRRTAGGTLAPVSSPRRDGDEAVRDLSLTHGFAELEFDRYDDFDILARSVAELSADLAEVQTQVGGLIGTIWADTAQIQRLTGSLRSEVTRARLVPVGKLFARFVRQVREAAKAAGKTVALEVSGETVEIDNGIIEQIADPLLHLVQNAVGHGIESEDERRARGKPAQGTVRLTAAHRGSFVYIGVEDDGQGIDIERLKAEAVRRGFVQSEAAALLSPPDALNLVFLPGFSTVSAVTPAAGRGVGLDVVRTNVSRVNGEIDVETEVGAGTRFTLKLPLTVVISDALLVRTGAETLAIPLSAVRVILSVRADTLQSLGRAETVQVDDELVDLVRLDRLLGLPAAAALPRIPVVVLRAGRVSLAVAVDELLGKEEVVVKTLGAFPQGVGPFAGATISGEGRVILLVDPGRLVELAGDPRYASAAHRVRAEEPEPPQPRPAAEVRRVLLVDDSISVRKFVGHMLERAGFRVVTANDGAEALLRLADTPVHAVITDLEMPRVNGYELIEDLRRRPATRNLPVVVLTTRAGPKHWSLARQLGVEHYVSKPVDEPAFVRLIRSLTAGQPAEAELAAAPR